jgi:elongation factor G
MKQYTAEHIRNIALVGHGGEGKTTLAEAMLFTTGAIDRMGRVEDGNTVTDFDAEENKRTISISTALAPVEHNGCKVNVIDAPGYFDFEGEQLQALRLADAALVVVGVLSGIAVGTEKSLNLCKSMGLPAIIFINQMDRENADFSKSLHELQERFGTNIAPVVIPIVAANKVKGYVDVITKKAKLGDAKGYKDADVPAELEDLLEECYNALVECAAESDDVLLEKFFGGEELTAEEITTGLRKGVAESRIIPLCAGTALGNSLVDVVIDRIIALMPSPTDRPTAPAQDAKSGEKRELVCEAGKPVVAQVIKTVADPFVGKLSILRVYQGTLKGGITVMNTTSGKAEKLGSVYTMRGKKQVDIDALQAGDIGAVAKLQSTNTGDTLCDSAMQVMMPPIVFPKPNISMAVSAAKKGEEDKVFGGLARLEEEDSTFKVFKDTETLETLVSGMGELHLEVIAKRLKNKFGVEAVLSDPRVPYRETIRKAVKAEGRHKKQSGGHGQFGHVWIEFEPLVEGDGFEFVDKIVGGVVPRNFIPAVEKGLRENLSRGVLAGFPIVGLRATLYDGSYHAVDSSEMAFKTAARLALKKGCLAANPVLLEPIYRVSVTVPDDYMGDIIGDMNRRRGRILGMNPMGGGKQQVVAEVPLAEVFKYATDLRSMTQARGEFITEFVRYEDVPANIASKVIEANKREEEEED